MILTCVVQSKQVEEAGYASAPGNVSLPEAEMRLKQFLRTQEEKQDTEETVDRRRRQQQLEVIKSLHRMIKYSPSSASSFVLC